MNVLMSVIIPVRNGDEKLLNLIRKLLIYRKYYSIEIILIDSESDNGIVSKIEKLPARPIKFVRIKKDSFNHGLTRNLGARIAKGKYIIYFSQDISLINPLFLRRFAQHMERNKKVVAVFGKQTPYESSSHIEKLNMQLFYSSLDQYANTDGSLIQDRENPFAPIGKNEYLWYALSNAFSCYRKSYLLEHPFPKTSYGEDILMGKKIISDARIKIYDNKCVCVHSHNFSLKEYAARQLEEMKLRKKLNLPHFRLTEKVYFLFHDKKKTWSERLSLLIALALDYAFKTALFLYFRITLLAKP